MAVKKLKEGSYDRPGYDSMYLVSWEDSLGDYHETKVKADYPQDAIDKIKKSKHIDKVVDVDKIDMFTSSKRIRKADDLEEDTSKKSGSKWGVYKYSRNGKKKEKELVKEFDTYEDAFAYASELRKYNKGSLRDGSFYGTEEITENTVKKSNGKWTNRGDDGTEHGEFNTKKQADAQRKAMYANGYKGESKKGDNKMSVKKLKESVLSDIYKEVRGRYPELKYKLLKYSGNNPYGIGTININGFHDPEVNVDIDKIDRFIKHLANKNNVELHTTTGPRGVWGPNGALTYIFSDRKTESIKENKGKSVKELKEDYYDGTVSTQEIMRMVEDLSSLIEMMDDNGVDRIKADSSTYGIGQRYAAFPGGFIDLSDPERYAYGGDEDEEYDEEEY